jgi:hypothetical protein
MSKRVIFGIVAIIIVLVANAIAIPLLSNFTGVLKNLLIISLPALDIAGVIVIIVYVLIGR